MEWNLINIIEKLYETWKNLATKNSPLTPRFGGTNRQFKIIFQKIFQTTWKLHFKNNEKIPGNLLKTWKNHGNIMEFC